VIRCIAILRRLLWLCLLLGGWACLVFVFQPYGHRNWTFAVIAVALSWVVWHRAPGAQNPRPLSALLDRLVRQSRSPLIGALSCWLGLIAASSLAPGGALPPPKSSSDTIRVVTWNILHGREGGAPWNRFGWSVRKHAFRSSLEATRPDILCVQEAVAEQVESVAHMLPGYRHAGVGRDDGHSAGEFCAIYFDARRFQQLEGGTFWLEEPADQPPSSTLLGPKRICTWVRLRDKPSGRCLRVYNTHLYLTEADRLRAVRLILELIAHGESTDAVLVAGDFNAAPDTPNRLLFEQSGLESSQALFGRPTAAPTYQFYGIRLRSLDDILVNRGFEVRRHRILDLKPGNTFPSDHFGVMADLAWHDARGAR
jgi:endonuclease/exonuclease/phosphatase family metal-dependent hydrolase